MNFNKYFVLFAILMAVLMSQTEAGWLKKVGQRIEKTVRNVRDAAEDGLEIAGKAAAVAGAVHNAAEEGLDAAQKASSFVDAVAELGK